MIARPSKNDVANPTLLLSNNPLFRGCSHEDISHLVVAGVTKRYAADEYVFVKGEAGFSCYLVIDGAVGIGSYSPDGRYCPMRELMPGDIFGEMALLDGQPRSADAVAIIPSKLLIIRRAPFVQILGRNACVSLNFLRMICARVRSVSKRADEGYFLDLSTRMARRLLTLPAPEPDSSATPLTCCLTQERLASIVGATRQSVNKQLRVWQATGIVELSRGCIIIRDFERLRSVALS